MQKSELLIVAAGKGSRMNSEVPKALIPVLGGEVNVVNTLRKAGRLFDKVTIVANIDIKDKWEEWKEGAPLELMNNVELKFIKSGLGDGHAVMESLGDINTFVRQDVVIIWGDVFLKDSRTVEELINKDYSVGATPVVFEKRPYVSLNACPKNPDLVKSVSFSKYGEQESEGYHDQSIFKFHKGLLNAALKTLHNALWKGDKYMCQGNELSLLYVFHYLYNLKSPAMMYETQYPTYSFNTQEELKAIQEELSK